MKTIAISQIFNHLQLHERSMHLLNTRICRYTCIYNTYSTNTTLLMNGRTASNNNNNTILL